MGRGLTSKVLAQRREQDAWKNLECTAAPPPAVDKEAARAAKRLEIEAKVAAFKRQQAEGTALLAGSTGTVCDRHGELGGRYITVEAYDSITCMATCVVTLCDGGKRVSLHRDDIENLSAPCMKKAPRLNVLVEQAAAASYFSEDRRVAAWLEAHRSAFAAESEWMEARDAQAIDIPADEAGRVLVELIFSDAAAPFIRTCFFAHIDGAATDACGYATVDVDPDPLKVCHVRMCMVSPTLQRQGVGKALLEKITTTFADRHLGVQFGNFAPHLEPFFGQAGFKRIGQDKLRTYMAVKRDL